MRVWIERNTSCTWIVGVYPVNQENKKPWFGGICLFRMHYGVFKDFFGWTPKVGETVQKDMFFLSPTEVKP